MLSAVRHLAVAEDGPEARRHRTQRGGAADEIAVEPEAFDGAVQPLGRPPVGVRVRQERAVADGDNGRDGHRLTNA